jgi:hypothetical protein
MMRLVHVVMMAIERITKCFLVNLVSITLENAKMLLVTVGT